MFSLFDHPPTTLLIATYTQYTHLHKQQSPSRLKAEIATLEASLEHKRTDLNEAEHRRRDISAKAENVEKYARDLDEVMELMTELGSEVDKVSSW